MREEIKRFRQAVSALGETGRPLLGAAGEQEMALAGEIRLRVGSPPALSFPAGVKYLDLPAVTREQMNAAVLSLCGGSLYSHQHELAAGFIATSCGHRAGVCGTAVMTDGKITAVRDITTVCLRVAREHDGCSCALEKQLFDIGVCSAMIAGSPCTGKTTLLRDLACRLAGRGLRVVIADERGELAMEPGSRVDRLCDVLRGYPKAEGILQAVRALSPDVVVFDELGTRAEAEAVTAGINAGVRVICSIHAGSFAELAAKPQIVPLLRLGVFDRFALLRGREQPGQVRTVISGEELNALAGGDSYYHMRSSDRNEQKGKAGLPKASA